MVADQVKYFKSGKLKFRIQIEENAKKIYLYFNWHHSDEWNNLKEEIRAMEGAKFSRDPIPHWEVNRTPRNLWALQYLDADAPDPYYRYDRELLDIKPNRSVLYDHQVVMIQHMLTRRECIVAAEMGTGKTLAFIEVLEHVRPKLAWYVAPRFSLTQIKLLFSEWEAKVWPIFLSYSEMRSLVMDWPEGRTAPDLVIFDEAQYLKTPASQRSQCAKHLTDGMRKDHEKPYIILASGAPAPKSPKDWWMQAEIACPGFLKEGNIIKMENCLALIKKEQSLAGGMYPKLITWWDDENKCAVCGEYKDHPNHMGNKSLEDKKKEIQEGLAGLAPKVSTCLTDDFHHFKPSVNEIDKLYRRLRGLVLVQFKKDCIDLPDIIYRIVKCPIKPTIKRAAKMITKTSPTTIQALTRLRELSDGFQYKEEPSDETTQCDRCFGRGKSIEFKEGEGEQYEVTCPNCDGAGVHTKMIRTTKRVPTPKDEALRELLEECEENGRIVVFAGFTASIDRVIDICKKAGWETIRADGTKECKSAKYGMSTSVPLNTHPLTAFQDKERKIPKLAFVAHPATAKTSLTLTASYMLVYYSNTFSGDDRIQSEARIHRIGMDKNKGAIIVDIIHLETDEYVRENLKKKRELQSVSLGELQKFMEETDHDCRR